MPFLFPFQGGGSWRNLMESASELAARSISSLVRTLRMLVPHMAQVKDMVANTVLILEGQQAIMEHQRKHPGHDLSAIVNQLQARMVEIDAELQRLYDVVDAVKSENGIEEPGPDDKVIML